MESKKGYIKKFEKTGGIIMTIKEKKEYENRIEINLELMEILQDTLGDVRYITTELTHYNCINEVRKKILENIQDKIWAVYNRLFREKSDCSIALIEEECAEYNAERIREETDTCS